jgi:hypothetical protein
MKYLNLFEEYNQYYTIADTNQNPIGNNKMKDIDQKDIDYIKKGLGINTKKDIVSCSVAEDLLCDTYIFFYNNLGELGNSNQMSNTNWIKRVRVLSYTDEWFKVSIDYKECLISIEKTKAANNPEHYWCDQVDGVIECVKDAINKDVYHRYISEKLDINKLPVVNMKLFEEYNPYYQEITTDEYCDAFDSIPNRNYVKSSHFTDAEIKILKSISGVNVDVGGFTAEIRYMGSPSMLFVKNYDKEVWHFPQMSKEETSLLWMIIDKLEDEWFYVYVNNYEKAYSSDRQEEEISRQLYKCDQFDGLMKLIEDKKKELSI